jgi:hypothetical protein
MWRQLEWRPRRWHKSYERVSLRHGTDREQRLWESWRVGWKEEVDWIRWQKFVGNGYEE